MSKTILNQTGLSPSAPLWQRAPTRDQKGRSYSDFMMIIPGLKKRTPDEIQQRIERLSSVLESYKHVIVFADLNMKINVLWVSFESVPGLTFEIAAAIKMQVPEAKLVSEQARPE